MAAPVSRQAAIVAGLLLAVGVTGWVYFQNEKLTTDLNEKPVSSCEHIKVPALDPGARATSFDKITMIVLSNGGQLTDSYPQRPYTVEIEGSGKISFINKTIPRWAEGEIASEQISTLLGALNDANFPHIVNMKSQPTAEASHSPITNITLTINGEEQTVSVSGCRWHEEMHKFIAAVNAASATFIEESFIKAAKAGNFEAQMQLASYYDTVPTSRPNSNFKEAYFWASVAEKTLATSKEKTDWDREWAHRKRTHFENFLTPEQVTEVKKRVEEWKLEEGAK
ncbi:MAG: hypothetical protein ACAH80_00760 [Alphaproteobacteria bacterium]